MGRKGERIQLQEDTIRTELTQVGEMSSPRRSSRRQNNKDKKGDDARKKMPWPVYKKFLRYSLRRWKFGLLCMIVTIISAATSSIFPWKIGLLLDLVSKQTDNNVNPEQFRQKLIDSMIQLAALTVSIAIFTFIRAVTLKIYQQKIAIDLRTQVYSTFIKNDLHFFQIHKTGELISRLGNDINEAKSAITNNLTFLLRNVIVILGTLIALFIMSWKLTFIVLSIVPIYAFVTQQYTRKSKLLVRKKQDLQAEISVHVGEKFGGIQAIKAYCAQDQQIQRYYSSLMSVYEVVKLRSLYQGIHNTCSTFLPSLASLLVLLYAGARLLSDDPQLSAGQLTSFILYCTNLTQTTAGISNSYTNIINGANAVQKVFEMMNYKRLVVEDVGKIAQINGQIQFVDVNFKYPLSQNPVFEGLSLKIQPGQFVAFVGQSGSGKSTILKLIQHFYRIQQGQILFGNQNSNQMNVKYLRSQIGLVNQEATIFSGTIQDNITFGLKDYTIQEVQIAAKKAGCEFIYNTTAFPDGFQSVVGQRGLNLSGGQRQRISIARALMRKPKILIFDEATSALDSNSEHLVQQSIQELASTSNITIIVVAHRLSTVIKCDRLYVMKEGKIVEVGSHKQLIRQKGYYYNLIQKQLYGELEVVQKQKDKQNSSPEKELSYSSPDIRMIRKGMKSRNTEQTDV